MLRAYECKTGHSKKQNYMTIAKEATPIPLDDQPQPAMGWTDGNMMRHSWQGQLTSTIQVLIRVWVSYDACMRQYSAHDVNCQDD